MNLTTICSVGLAATVFVCGMDVFCAATAKKRLYASDIVWAVLFAGVQAFVFAWSAQGLIEADEGALTLMSVVVLDTRASRWRTSRSRAVPRRAG